MRNVMVRWIAVVTLLIGLLSTTLLQTEAASNAYSQSWDESAGTASDDWQPIAVNRRIQTGPVEYERPQRYFDAQSESNQPRAVLSHRKSFQGVPHSNRLEGYGSPPNILGAFNSFRDPSIGKIHRHNNHIGQQLSVPHHKITQAQFYGQRYPAYVQPPVQPANNLKYQSPLLASPANGVATTIQIFPPSPQNPFSHNSGYVNSGGVQKQVHYSPAIDSDTLATKLSQNNNYQQQTALVNPSNIPTIYGTRDTFNLPAVFKPAPFSINSQFVESPTYDIGGGEQRYAHAPDNLVQADYQNENILRKNPFGDMTLGVVKHHKQSPKVVKTIFEEKSPNPSKQVYEQLSRYGRPFSVTTEGTRHKIENPNLLSVHENSFGANPTVKSGKFAVHTHYKGENPSSMSEPHYIPFRANGRPMTIHSDFRETVNDGSEDDSRKSQNVRVNTYPSQHGQREPAILSHHKGVRVSNGGGKNQGWENSGKNYKSVTRLSHSGVPFLPTPTDTSNEEQNFQSDSKIPTTPSDFDNTLNNLQVFKQSNGMHVKDTQEVYSKKFPATTTTISSSYNNPTVNNNNNNNYNVRYQEEPASQQPIANELEEDIVTANPYEDHTTRRPQRRRKPSRHQQTRTEASRTTAQYTESPSEMVVPLEENNKYISTTAQKTSSHSELVTDYGSTRRRKPQYHSKIPQSIKEAEEYSASTRKQQKQTYSQPDYEFDQRNRYANSDHISDYQKPQPSRPNYPLEYNSQDQSNHQLEENDNSQWESATNTPAATYTQPSLIVTTTTTPVVTTTTSPSTTTTEPSTEKAPRTKPKFGGSRPKFSVKEYRGRSTTTTTVATDQDPPESEIPEPEKKPIRKLSYGLKSRYPPGKNETIENSALQESESSTEQTIRKYKPRTRPSKYKIPSSTTVHPILETTTTERTNTFRPTGTTKYKPGYYSKKYRTTTESINDLEDAAPASSVKEPVRTKLLFSAKRPSILKSKTSLAHARDDEQDSLVEESRIVAAEEATTAAAKTVLKFPKKEYKTIVRAREKSDDSSLTTMLTSSEEVQESNLVPEVTVGPATSSSDKFSSLRDDFLEDDQPLFPEPPIKNSETVHSVTTYEVPTTAPLNTELTPSIRQNEIVPQHNSHMIIHQFSDDTQTVAASRHKDEFPENEPIPLSEEFFRSLASKDKYDEKRR